MNSLSLKIFLIALMMEAVSTSESSASFCQTTVRLPAKKSWLECGVVGDVMPFDGVRDIHFSKTFDATIHCENMPYLTIILFFEWFSRF
jgi:hypothetical protein